MKNFSERRVADLSGTSQINQRQRQPLTDNGMCPARKIGNA
jgi:hypothetical protein